MELDEKKVGLAVIAVMLVSFIWMITTGIAAGNIIPLIIFSVSLSTAVVLFGDWFRSEE